MPPIMGPEKLVDDTQTRSLAQARGGPSEHSGNRACRRGSWGERKGLRRPRLVLCGATSAPGGHDRRRDTCDVARLAALRSALVPAGGHGSASGARAGRD